MMKQYQQVVATRRSPVKLRLMSLEKLSTFLNSIKRGSVNTFECYLVGFVSFQQFLDSSKYKGNNPDTVLDKIKTNKIDVYELLDSFISFLHGSPKTIRLKVEALRSFFEFHDFEVSSKKFKRRCRPPKLYRDDEQALTTTDIRNMLLHCSNKRLKAYLLLLATGGLRAVEGLAIRHKDIDFNSKPTKVHVRKEYSKTRTARYCFISDEATHYLQQWIAWKNRPKINKKYANMIIKPEELVFSRFHNPSISPLTVYKKMQPQFATLRDSVGLSENKEGSGLSKRGMITLHSFRRFVKTVLSDNISAEYSEWFLGHAKSSYWVRDPEHKASEYLRVMKFLTFIDYTSLESVGKSNEANLEQAQKEIEQLKKQLSSMSYANQEVEKIRKDMREELDKFKENLKKSVMEQLGLKS